MAKRKTPSQWQALIEQQEQSGLSIPQFCSQHSISSASFYKWRQRLSTPEPSLSKELTPSFIDLSTLSASRDHQNASDKPWHIVLSLGNGIELRLSQP